MSVNYRTRNQLVLAKIQSAEDAEATPTPSANAIRAIGPRFSPNLEQVSTDDEVTSSLSVASPIQAGGNGGMQFGLYARSIATVGAAAPEIGPLLRACAMSETLTAAAVTGTAQAGGASSITLALAASATADLYKGMPIRITGGTGSGQVNVVSAYNGTTKVATVAVPWTTAPDATSTYSIDANALYKPVTTGLEFLTLWAYQHHNATASNSRRRRIMDAMGNMSFSVAPRQLGTFNFTFTGEITAAPDNVARPSEPTYVGAEPEAFLNAQAYLAGTAVKVNQFSLDLGNQVSMFDNPAGAYGYDSAQVGLRKPTGRIVPPLELLSVRDAFGDWLNGTERSLWLRWGSDAGKRVSLFLPRLRYTGNEETDVRSYAAEGIPFQAVGNDAEIYICFH